MFPLHISSRGEGTHTLMPVGGILSLSSDSVISDHSELSPLQVVNKTLESKLVEERVKEDCQKRN